jgi:hypothetical protein
MITIVIKLDTSRHRHGIIDNRVWDFLTFLFVVKAKLFGRKNTNGIKLAQDPLQVWYDYRGTKIFSIN